MATFDEIVAQLRNPGDTGIAPELFDTLAQTYQDDISIRDAAVTERDATILERDAALIESASEIKRIKAANYDLMITKTSGGNQSDDDTIQDDKPKGIDSLFE